MLFNSLGFLIFFSIVVFVYFSLSHKYRWAFLLTASYYFYMCWKIEYIVLIIVSTLIDYFAGIKMGETSNVSVRRRYLAISLLSNLGLLFAFKYFNFFSDSFRVLLNHFNVFYNVPVFKALLPVGISFYTFQTMSYSIDVYRGIKKPEKHLGIFALYVSFFPQLVAGPIERSTRLLPQFFEKKEFDYLRVSNGLKLMLWGLFKKIVIADRLAILVNTVYNNPTEFTGLPLILATIFFAFQIYCDFSGYSDIAIGAAQILGFKLMNNFNRPYFSKSISEFWKRWHISLSSWFRDYLYIPLGGSKVVKVRWYYNLFITFIISGLWHGANRTFLVWGALHGGYLIMSFWLSGIRGSLEQALGLLDRPVLHKYVRVGTTFFLVCFAWIFFRANSLPEAIYIIKASFTGSLRTFHAFILLDFSTVAKLIRGAGGQGLGLNKAELLIAFVSLGFMEYVHLIQRHGSIRHMLDNKPTWIRWLIYYAIVLMILFFGVFQKTPFIYFQF